MSSNIDCLKQRYTAKQTTNIKGTRKFISLRISFSETGEIKGVLNTVDVEIQHRSQDGSKPLSNLVLGRTYDRENRSQWGTILMCFRQLIETGANRTNGSNLVRNLGRKMTILDPFNKFLLEFGLNGHSFVVCIDRTKRTKFGRVP